MSAPSSPLLQQAPKPSPKELEAGKVPRKEAREKVLALKTKWETKYKPLNDKLQLSSRDTSPLTSLFQKEEAWFTANIEVTKQQVETEMIKFQESYDSLVTQYNEAVRKHFETVELQLAKQVLADWPNPQEKAVLQNVISKREQEANKKQAEDKKKEKDKSTWDITKQALKDITPYIFLIFYLVLASRFGSMAANEVFHKPLLYRVLAFTYAFILCPFYIFKYARMQFASYFSDKALQPVFGFFPLFPYTESPDKETTVFERLFGYPDAPDVRTYVSTKIKEDEKRAEEAVSHIASFLQTVKQAKVEERKQA